MDTTLRCEVEGLSRMTVPQLRERYVDVFGESSRSYNKDFLRKRIAWRLQVLAYGGLSERARRRAEELAADADLRIRAPRPHDPDGGASRQCRAKQPPRSKRDPRLPPPGELLVRDYRGVTVVVRVLEDGFEYDGRLFHSLSPIAREVTGTNWNGFAFFQLK